MMIDEDLREMADHMLHELDSKRLSVTIAPPLPGSGTNWRRIVDGRNPSWYRQFCAAYPATRSRPRRRRLPDTAIKRSHTRRALREIASGRAESEYARRLLPFVDTEWRRICQQPWCVLD